MPSPDHANEVAASVIIVAWRLGDELRECLDSIQGSVDAPSYEVIVVLNGASPEAIEVAQSHPAVTRTISRYANIGFGRACNLAATVARGESLIFLNDDTRVDSLWLKHITDAGQERTAVASLLLNYDGTVQEAGSRLLSHGGTLQIGKGLTLDEARSQGLLDARAIDYGSAAALLVKRTAFDRLGGFDPAFEPAYFEDVDLQLRLRQTGGDVWFEPAAKVLHLSGKSTSSDHWFRQFAANRSGYRFIERWDHVLAGSPGADDPVDVITPVAPHEQPAPRSALDTLDSDDSAAVALRIAQDYSSWLTEQLELYGDFHIEMRDNVPSRKELLERSHKLLTRLNDIEQRGFFGLIKMRLGLWFLRRREAARIKRGESPAS